ncbi:putative efflux pump antibiotic resistance protein [Annulohypoxylon maeteangense]|uniref:putative efflux pump antibiotic resistance protein n=1 Tax=Annulohypoxylon maeteangense TaxID=1927788 RepID=UPI00200729DA|nr:putative efflux pump antibiotic resistance protein [Annulohypoxylon maeteangense]KAI0882850.1 putative efflux pump antibiotic resistance protein [Annulohypoxylon maeteangense]
MSSDENVGLAASKKVDDSIVEKTGTCSPVLTGSVEVDDRIIVYLHGIRFAMLATLIGIMVFIVSIEGSIAATSLITITSDLGDFERVSWILSSYQLGFVALIVIAAKLSDLFGRKPIIAGLIVVFTAFSAGCASVHTMTQLIVMRAFQGLGAGGCYTLTSILIVDSAPPEKYGKYVSFAGMAIAMGAVLGPIFGGAITEHTTWRWIFWFNVPVGGFALFLTLLGMPRDFPYNDQGRRHRSINDIYTTIWTKIDFPGSMLLLGAVLSFTACFQEADSRFPWKSAYVITLLITSVVLSIILLLWERRVTLAGKTREPVLPWRFFTNRVMVSIILVMTLVGAPMSVTTFQLPQRFQLVNGLSSLDAGLRLLPYGLMFSAGSMVGTTVASKLKIPAIYMLFVGSGLQIIGYAFLSTLDTTLQINPKVYGYLILSGFGCGITFIMAYITVPFTVTEFDKAVGLASANQFRTMGSAMGLAIATSVFNGYTLPRFAGLGIQDPAADLITGQQFLPAALQDEGRLILSEGYNRQMTVLCAFSAAQIPAALLMWKRKQMVIA